MLIWKCTYVTKGQFVPWVDHCCGEWLLTAEKARYFPGKCVLVNSWNMVLVSLIQVDTLGLLLSIRHTFTYWNTDTFWNLCSERLLKTLWPKEKLLKTSNFSLVIMPHCLQHFTEIVLGTFIEVFHFLAQMFMNLSVADLLNVGKG